MVLHEYALELAWREAEDKQRVSDGVRDEWKEGEREGRGKEMKRKEERPYHDDPHLGTHLPHWSYCTLCHPPLNYPATQVTCGLVLALPQCLSMHDFWFYCIAQLVDM